MSVINRRREARVIGTTWEAIREATAVEDEAAWSAWDRFLPPQAFRLRLLLIGAADGDLERAATADKSFVEEAGALDGLISWLGPADDVEFDFEVERLIQKKQRFERVVRSAGFEPPKTVRELAALMADLGLFHRAVDEGRESWRLPEAPPRPEHCLPVTSDLAPEPLHDPGFEWMTERILRRLQEGPRREFPTTVTELAERCGLTIENARRGVKELMDTELARLVRRTEVEVDPEDAPASKPLMLIVDDNVMTQYAPKPAQPWQPESVPPASDTQAAQAGTAPATAGRRPRLLLERLFKTVEGPGWTKPLRNRPCVRRGRGTAAGYSTYWTGLLDRLDRAIAPGYCTGTPSQDMGAGRRGADKESF